MKLLRSIAAILVMALIVVGCSTGAPSSGNQGSAPNNSAPPAGTTTSPNDSGSQAAAPSGKPIKIGNILPLTGRAASLGQLQRIALELAMEDVNAQGGINGHPLEIIFEDDQLNPQQSVTLFRKLVNDDQVLAVIGPQSGGGFEAVAPLANQFETPTINVNALKPGIAKLPWAMRFHSPDNYMIPEGVKKFVQAYPHVKRVVIIGDVKEASGAAGMEEFEKAAIAEGLEVIDKVGYQTGATDFSAAITKVKSYNPDAVFVSSLLAETLGAAKEMERQGFNIPILVNALTWVGVFPISAETAAKNWHTIGFSTNEVDPNENPELADFTNRFIEKSLSNSQIQQPANVANNALAYDAVMIIADILRKEGITPDTPLKEARQKLRDNLVQIRDHDGLYKFSMTESGDGYIESKVLKADLEKKIWVELK